MFSREPRSPIWLVPTLVMTASVGWQAAARRSISCGWFMPSSQTRTSESSGAESTVSGRPMRLLKLPTVACVQRWEEMPQRSMSLVVVLPTEPVTPTTTHSGCIRRHRAAARSIHSSQSSPSARTTQQPRPRAASRSASDTSALATTRAAPASMAERT